MLAFGMKSTPSVADEPRGYGCFILLSPDPLLLILLHSPYLPLLFVFLRFARIVGGKYTWGGCSALCVLLVLIMVPKFHLVNGVKCIQKHHWNHHSLGWCMGRRAGRWPLSRT